MVPVPSTAPSASVTTGEIATELACTSLAELTVMPLLELIAPAPLRINVPPFTAVAPV